MMIAPNTGIGLIQLMCRNDPNGPVEEEFAEKVYDLYHHLNMRNCDMQLLKTKVDEILSEFENHTKLKSKSLDPENKLYLMYAIRDIMDDVKVAAQGSIEREKIKNSHPALPALDVALSVLQFVKICSAEEVLVRQIDNFERLLAKDGKFKSLERKVMKNYADPPSVSEFSQGSEKKEVTARQKTEGMFLQIREQMNQSHQLKRNAEIDKTYFDFEKDIANPVFNLFNNTALEAKHGIIQVITDSLTPSVVFRSDLGFKEILEETIVQSKKFQSSSFLREIGGAPIAHHVATRFSKNLELAAHPKNLARIAVKMNDTISHLFKVLKRLDAGATHENFIYALEGDDFKHNSYDEYIERSCVSIIDSLIKLIRVNHKTDRKLINRMGKLAAEAEDASIIKLVEFLDKHLINLEKFKNKLSRIPQFRKDDRRLQKLGIAHEYQKINANIQIITLHLLRTFALELENVVREAQKAEKNGMEVDVSKMSDEEALGAIKDSCCEMIDSLGNLQVKGQVEGAVIENLSSYFFRRGINAALKQIIQIQGSNNLLDGATSIYYELIDEWRDWIKK